MELFNPKDLFEERPALFGNGDYFPKFLMYILRFDKLNRIYGKIVQKQGVEFIDELIETLGFNIEFDEKELTKIPKEGPLIVVSNHPLGGFDGLLLIKYLSMVRKDIKALANFLLKRITPVSEYFLSENPFEVTEQDENRQSEAMKHLENNGVLCLFPAIDLESKDTFDGVPDHEWQFPSVRFIKNARVPVIPVLFQGSNSRLLRIAAKIHPSLKQARMPSEILSKRHKNIKLRIITD